MTRPTSAVILAAGMGSRLAATFADAPKGFVQVNGEALIERSVRLLAAHGIADIVIVVGFKKEFYEAFARTRQDVRIVENRDYEATGTLASLAAALTEVTRSFLLLESDLFYEPRALTALLEDPRADLVLLSGYTRAGDEVWAAIANGELRGLSKNARQLATIDGEFVGICKISAALGRTLATLAASCDPLAAYETDALAAIATRQSVPVLKLDGLRWGEVDDAAQLRRVRDELGAL